MPFEFTPRERPEGEYMSMTDVKKLGEPLNAMAVLDDDQNTYNGEKKPRFLVRGTLGDGEKVVLVSCPKGYSRDDFLVALQEHLESGEDESVAIRFVGTKGSAYIDIQVA